MKTIATLTLALSVALLGPVAASVSDGFASIQKHRIQMHQAINRSFNAL